MTAYGILIVYVVIGCGAAVAVAVGRRRVAGLEGAAGACLMLLLWPFLVPTTLMVEALPPMPVAPRAGSPRARKIDAAARGLHQVWAAAGAGEARERAMVEGFVARLRAKETRLADLESAIASAPESVRARLDGLREATAREIDQGVALLDDLVAQLTVLRFSELAEREACSSERVHVEGLLGRIEALADLSLEAPPAPAP